MEDLIAFLVTDAGKILCVALIFIGISDVVIVRLIFGKKIVALEQKLISGISTEQNGDIKNKIKGFEVIKNVVTISGIVFIAFGIFGLTR